MQLLIQPYRSRSSNRFATIAFLCLLWRYLANLVVGLRANDEFSLALGAINQLGHAAVVVYGVWPLLLAVAARAVLRWRRCWLGDERGASPGAGGGGGGGGSMEESDLRSEVVPTEFSAVGSERDLSMPLLDSSSRKPSVPPPLSRSDSLVGGSDVGDSAL